jgi:hypothetical protein
MEIIYRLKKGPKHVAKNKIDGYRCLVLTVLVYKFVVLYLGAWMVFCLPFAHVL